MPTVTLEFSLRRAAMASPAVPPPQMIKSKEVWVKSSMEEIGDEEAWSLDSGRAIGKVGHQKVMYAADVSDENKT
jgi:hypothetical protein